MTILYVDDDIEDIEIFHDAVKTVDPSIRYFTATNGKEAFEFLYGDNPMPNHIIFDINMPGMDGKSCLEELRKDPQFNEINVVIYSTNSFPKDVEQIEALGARFIKKANSFNDLCEMVRKLAAEKRNAV